MSGADQSQLSIALRFFKLVSGENREFTERMRRLVQASEDAAQLKDALTELVGEYDDIVGDLDDSATSQQLTEAFRDRTGLSGETRAKAIRFYLAIARAAGVKVSEHFATPPASGAAPRSTERAKRTNGRAKRVRHNSPDGTRVGGERENADEVSKKLRFTVPSGDIQVWLPEGITTPELDALAKYLRDYVGLVGGKA
jgi:hypothetical protein